MKIGQAGLDLIKRFEGKRSRPYLCPARIWTIGYGHVLYPEQLRLKMDERLAYPLKPDDNRVFTSEEIDGLLMDELGKYERGVARLCPGPLTQGQFDALTSFAFNVGVGCLQRSTIRSAINRGDFEMAADTFLKYNKAGGKELKGLTLRRQAERALFLA
jgi:lysozyme